MICILSRGAFS